VLAGLLSAGDLVLLVGDLGAGKTALTQGVAAGLGVTQRVTSPTFVLTKTYRGSRCGLLHIDAYRLATIGEIDDLGVEAALADSVVMVEWGEALAPVYSANVVIRISGEGDVREFDISLAGEGASAREPKWRTELVSFMR
jgi:tRNA threonylcarbamoyladenosine biosynthesis protein TsaE